jgi:hypothetical protein
VALTLGGTTHAVTADAQGVWTYTLTANDITGMTQGPEILSATATDAAGNTSPAATRTINVDTIAPNAPVISLVAGDDIVNSAERSVAVTGTAEALARVALTIGGAVRQVTADAQGVWSYTLTPEDVAAMDEGAETLSATATDLAGNVSSAVTRNITVDTLAPDAPVISAVATDNIVNASEQAAAISGTAEANASIALTLGSNVRTVTANAQGQWTYTLTPADIAAMGDGPETISATATDKAGNTSAPRQRDITIDTLAPDAPVISVVAGDNVVNASEQAVAITGTAEASACSAPSAMSSSEAQIAVTFGAFVNIVSVTSSAF